MRAGASICAVPVALGAAITTTTRSTCRDSSVPPERRAQSSSPRRSGLLDIIEDADPEGRTVLALGPFARRHALLSQNLRQGARRPALSPDHTEDVADDLHLCLVNLVGISGGIELEPVPGVCRATIFPSRALGNLLRRLPSAILRRSK